MSLVKERQKMILLADKSPFGWKPSLSMSIMTWRTTKKTGRRSTERKLRRPGIRNVSLLVVTRSTSALPIARNSQLAVAQFPNKFTRLNPQLSPVVCFSCSKPGHRRAACSNNSFANNFPNQQPSQGDEHGAMPKSKT